MREIKIEVLWLRHKKDFTTEILKHYTTVDRLCNGLDKFDYKMVDVIAKRQYTGLKDANGVEIYEGDIVNDHVGRGVVKYSNKHGAFRVSYGDGLAKWFYDYILNGERESIEVIGNIHENPELLS